MDNIAKNINESAKEDALNKGYLTTEQAMKGNPTPAMRQYLQLKAEHSEYLLFYRMGDFYELFYEDAITASGALGLTLTSRSGEKDIPMCGVPFHAYEIYLTRLIKMGYKVAICEQMETPEQAKARGHKTVNREIVRLVTSGTLTEDCMLEAKKSNYIASICVRSGEVGVAWLDVSTGAFFMQRVQTSKEQEVEQVSSVLARLSPAELLIEDKLLEYPKYFELFREFRDVMSPRAKEIFNYDSAYHTLLKAYNVQAIEVFGDFSRVEIMASGVLLDYVENTQKGILPRLEKPCRILGDDMVDIDASTRRSLELLSTTNVRGVSLLKVMDRTVTNGGGRLLAERLASPIMNVREINDRLDMVTFFLNNPNVRTKLREVLRQTTDIKRSIQRICMQRGGPKDLYDLAYSLRLIPEIKNILLSFALYQEDSIYAQVPQVLDELVNRFFDHSYLVESIINALPEDKKDLPTLTRNGGFIREGAYAELDYLRNVRDESKTKCEYLRDLYAQETGVTGLKIKDNSVIGYFVEVPSKFANILFDNPKFIHRQSVLNAVRFTTVELSELENEVNSSTEKALEMELRIYEELSLHAIAQVDAISRGAEVISILDVSAGLAELAEECNYVRPVVDDSLDFEIIGGRHPVVEYVMQKSGDGNFVGNNCVLNHGGDDIWLLTGPNMAGKSTFLRQNAIITIMAQMGAYVPAEKARIGAVDKVFSRVGASDDLANGRSTFMVEMVETASILNRATERSFVILDEIGRGTATFDGVSIAWSVVEHLAEINKCRTIFATHYHELTKLCSRIKRLSLHCMKIKEFNGEVVFMHEVIDGATDRSYGIHVARLAGLPELTIKRAEQVLRVMEEEKQNKILTAIEDDLPLFEVLKQKEEAVVVEESPVVLALRELDVDDLSPRDALAKLYELKSKV